MATNLFHLYSILCMLFSAYSFSFARFCYYQDGGRWFFYFWHSVFLCCLMPHFSMFSQIFIRFFFGRLKWRKKIIVFETSTAEKTEFNHVYDNGYAATIARTAFLIEPILYQDNKRMMLFAKSLVIITGCSSQYQASRQPILSQWTWTKIETNDMLICLMLLCWIFFLFHLHVCVLFEYIFFSKHRIGIESSAQHSTVHRGAHKQVTYVIVDTLYFFVVVVSAKKTTFFLCLKCTYYDGGFLPFFFVAILVLSSFFLFHSLIFVSRLFCF